MELKFFKNSYFEQLFENLRPKLQYSKTRFFVTSHFSTLFHQLGKATKEYTEELICIFCEPSLPVMANIFCCFASHTKNDQQILRLKFPDFYLISVTDLEKFPVVHCQF